MLPAYYNCTSLWPYALGPNGHFELHMLLTPEQPLTISPNPIHEEVCFDNDKYLCHLLRCKTSETSIIISKIIERI
jgi:hypothetical protein